MKNKKVFGVIVFMVLIVVGMFWVMLKESKSTQPNWAIMLESKPPQPKLSLDGKSVQALQGSYCWSSFGKGTCVDMISPPEMIKQNQYTPHVSAPESKLTIQFAEEPTMGNLVIRQWNEGNSEVEIKNNSITLPKQKGSYIYVIDGRWKEGSSSYVFAVEVR